MDSFSALCADTLFECPCEPIHYGLVVHRTITLGGFHDTSWSVSDPVCGCKVCEGEGREGALLALERIRQDFGSAAAFLAELYRQRDRIQRGLPPTDRSRPH